MKQEIVIPRMGESISEATIGTILKPTGSAVKIDEEILELETDKVNQVIYAPSNGIVSLTVKQGDNVKIGQSVGFVDTEAKGETLEKVSASEKPPEPKTVQKAVPSETERPALRKGKESFLSEFNAPVKKDADVQKVETIPLAFTAKPKEIQSERSEMRQKLSKIRRVIAERLVEAKNSTAMLTTFNEVDLTQVIQLRERYKELFQKEYQVKLGFMSFFVKASVSALKEYPVVNSYIDGDELVHRNYFDIGVAVGTERGVIVPVVRSCDHLTFAEIEQSIDRFSARAKQGSLTIDELQGGGFTITNGGIYGSLLSTPILNPPQAAILGMHNIVKRPIAVNDQVVIRPMMYLALTYDHRVIDGKEAVSFLVHIKQCLEDPTRILLEI